MCMYILTYPETDWQIKRQRGRNRGGEGNAGVVAKSGVQMGWGCGGGGAA